MTSTVTQAEIQEAAVALEERMTYVSIMTEEDFNVMMQARETSSIVPYTLNGSPLRTRPSAPEWLADHIIDPVYNDPYAVPAVFGSMDLIKLNSRARREGGMFGLKYRYSRDTPNGRRYVIFEGDYNQRATLTKRQWRADHPKVLALGIGRQAGGMSEILGGIKVALYAGVAFETFLWLFQNDHTFADLLGGITAELSKGAIASIAGGIGAAIAASVSTLAFAPAAGFIVFGLIAGVALNHLDDHFQFKAELQEAAAIALNWMRRHTGSLGEWTAEQYEELSQAINSWADGLRHSLDTAIEDSDNRWNELVHGSGPDMLRGRQMHSEAMNRGVLSLIRGLIGD